MQPKYRKGLEAQTPWFSLCSGKEVEAGRLEQGEPEAQTPGYSSCSGGGTEPRCLGFPSTKYLDHNNT